MKENMKKLMLLLGIALLLSVVACGNSNRDNTIKDDRADAGRETVDESVHQMLVSEGIMELEYAELFRIEQFQGGYRMITAGTGGHRYLVVPEDMDVPAELDEDIYVLKQPINKLYVASTSIVSLIDAIGALECVPLVGTDIGGWYLENVITAMENGRVQFGGKFSQPNYEVITGEEIQFHINNTMVDSKPEVLEKFEELGIPTLVENSSKEAHPLARVEWVKLLGVLLNREEEAARYFEEQKALLNSVTAEVPFGKTVAMGYMAGDKCYVRNGGDYCAQLIKMAGGTYVCADTEPEKGGNSTMAFEEWYVRFKDADYLFYMNFTDKFYSIEEMVASNPLFLDFKAVQNGNVWVTSPAFHQSVADIASIVVDMHTILASEDPSQVTTEHLIKIF